MSLKQLRKRLTASVEELDALRLQQRYRGLGVTPIGDAVPRLPVRLGGEVQRLRTVPASGVPTLEVMVSDGTGEAVALFTGRRAIGGIEHGRGILLEGVGRVERGRLVLVNPVYTLLPG